MAVEYSSLMTTIEKRLADVPKRTIPRRMYPSPTKRTSLIPATAAVAEDGAKEYEYEELMSVEFWDGFHQCL
jgi:hypothetical protein